MHGRRPRSWVSASAFSCSIHERLPGVLHETRRERRYNREEEVGRCPTRHCMLYHPEHQVLSLHIIDVIAIIEIMYSSHSIFCPKAGFKRLV